MKNPDPNPHHGLQLQVRALWCAVALLCVAATAANVRPLQISNADDTPTTNVNLSGTHWTGTLDTARLPVNVPILDGSGALTVSGGFATDADTNIDPTGAGYFSALNVDGDFSANGNATLASGNVNIDDEGNVQVRSLGVGSGGFISGQGDVTGQSLTTQGGLSTDNGLFGTDGSGNVSAGNLNLTGTANVGGDVSASGRVSGGEIHTSNATVADADGYVWTGSQPYQDGTFAPTGYLTFKDASGNVYCVPAVARP